MNDLISALSDEEIEQLDDFLLHRVEDDAFTEGKDEGVIGISELDGLFTALVSGPGFGQLLFAGLARLGAVNSFNQVLAGTFGCLLVAAVYEIVFFLVARLTTPKGIRV